MAEVLSVAKVGVEVCVKYLAPTKNLHKGIERQAIITDLVFENAKYFDKETKERLDDMQEMLDLRMSKVAGGQATKLSSQAKRRYEQSQKTTVASESVSIKLDNVELSKGTKSLELPFALNKDYIVSAMFHLRPAEGATETSIAIPDGAQSIALHGTIDLIEHAHPEHSDGETVPSPDVEVAFRDMTCTVVP